MNKIHKPENLTYKQRDEKERLNMTYSLSRMKQRESKMMDKFCSQYRTKYNDKEGIEAGERAVVACLYRVHNQNNEK
jgi:hypothetical protein